MPNLKLLDDDTIQEIKTQVTTTLKDKRLTRDQINDHIFVEALSRLAIEDRYKVLEACMYNDTFRRIRYRKTKA
jgi:hypothetical protein